MIGTLEFVLLVMWVPIAATWLAAPLLGLGLRRYPVEPAPARIGLRGPGLPPVPPDLPFVPTIVVYERVCATDDALTRYIAALESIVADPCPPGRFEASLVAERRNAFESEALSLLSICGEWFDAVKRHPSHNALVAPIIESLDDHTHQVLVSLLLPHEQLAARIDWHYGVGRLRAIRNHLEQLASGLRAYREALSATSTSPYR